MLSISGQSFVLWLHVVAACVWIGGQATVAAVIPMLRGHGDLAARAGRRYQAIAWPAYAVLIVTGIVNVGNAGLSWSDLLSTPAGRTLLVKIGFVAVSGLAAGAHSLIQAPRRREGRAGGAVSSAVFGSVSLVSAVLAALYGVVIAGT
jgi:putative copper export protein